MTRVIPCLLLLAAAARADGKFVSTQVPVVEIPDQRAIVVFKDGRERLVIDTAYAGAEGDLAWIVPLPAPPKIEPVSPAVFRTLEAVTMPDVVDRPSDAWKAALLFLVLVAAMAAIPGGHLVARIVVFVLWFFLFAFFALVGLAAKGAFVGVTVLGRADAGQYETATLEARDAGALLAWLDENGFRVSSDVRAGIDEYIREGWVFAVARLKVDAPASRPHPLCFEFAAEGPVYPLRLTGTQDRPLSLRIFVFADERAGSDRLATESCYSIARAEGSRFFGRDQGERRHIGQPELLELADGATVLTTLRGDLEPDDMRRDLALAFEEFDPLVPVKYSEDAARSSALGVVLWCALLLLLPCYLAVWTIARRRAGGRWREILRTRVENVALTGQLVAWGAALGLGLVAGAVDYAASDVVAMRGGEGDTLGPHSLLRHHWSVGEAIAGTETVADAREIAEREWKGRKNPYDGLPVREEWSPGNYGFEIIDGKVSYVHYDARGTASTFR